MQVRQINPAPTNTPLIQVSAPHTQSTQITGVPEINSFMPQLTGALAVMAQAIAMLADAILSDKNAANKLKATLDQAIQALATSNQANLLSASHALHQIEPTPDPIQASISTNPQPSTITTNSILTSTEDIKQTASAAVTKLTPTPSKSLPSKLQTKPHSPQSTTPLALPKRTIIKVPRPTRKTNARKSQN